MIQLLKKLLGLGPKIDYAQLTKEGAIIIDVRSKSEYASGHIDGAIHIPLDSLEENLGKLKDKNKTIITCCASGMRSGVAKNILTSKGYLNVYNGGSWSGLQRKIS
ncbi:MAG: rhodanese-like domain-containing protein [Bacteroidota bacterium]